MEITNLKIFKIDIDQEEVQNIDSSDYGLELENYLRELFQIVISGSSGRQFHFDRETTEVRSQISRIIANENFSDISNIIAKRLLDSEHTAQEGVAKLGITIQKGIVVQALITDNQVKKFIICKADHNEFLNEINYRTTRGLPVKKKAFKAFVCTLNEGNIVDNVLVYDTNPSETKYWWKEFLELTMVFSDEDNTEKAFNAIDKGVFTKMRNDHPLDYTYLRNSTVKYFRSNDTFEIQDFLDSAIGNYIPVDSTLNIDQLKSKIRELPSKSRSPFDNQFNIVKEKIKARFQNTVKLTNQIDLRFKEDIPNIDTVVMAEQAADGTKYVKIKSEEGYRYFKNLSNANNQ